MKRFLSCDWGSSTFRLRLVEIPTLNIIAGESSDDGITSTFQVWKQSGEKEEKRLLFYLKIMQKHIGKLEKKLNASLNDVPIIISGMASSTIGMIELPYKDFPFSADGGDLTTKIIEANNAFTHKTAIISGAKTKDDAMRGEETILAGCFNDNFFEVQTFIFPGTHSKHIVVKEGKAVTLKTYMTGEFFELLSKKSILSVSVEEENDLPKNIRHFKRGINDSEGNLLNTCFHIRTNDLFGKMTRQQNYHYLSGLLIGAEMKELMNDKFMSMTLVCNAILNPYYKTAFNALNKGKAILKIKDADKALIQGQFNILNRLLNR